MPIQVDVGRRLQDIAEATFQVAADQGLRAVTIRSVASRLGASTTVITNYLPTRADLLANALDLVNDEWMAELERFSQVESAPEALRAVMRAAVSVDDAEFLRCQFWVALLAEPHRPADVSARLAKAADSIRQKLADLVTAAGHPAPEDAADTLFLFAQGVFVSVVETPEVWTAVRLRSAADAAVDATLGLVNHSAR